MNASIVRSDRDILSLDAFPKLKKEGKIQLTQPNANKYAVKNNFELEIVSSKTMGSSSKSSEATLSPSLRCKAN